MRQYLIIISKVVIGLVILLIVGGILLRLLPISKKQGYNNSSTLSVIDYYETVALKSLMLYQIYDKDSYELAKSELKSFLDENVYKQYFVSDVYPDSNNSKPIVEKTKVVVDITKFEDSKEALFKIDFKYTVNSGSRDVTTLVTVENGKITGIERI